MLLSYRGVSAKKMTVNCLLTRSEKERERNFCLRSEEVGGNKCQKVLA